MVTIALLDAQGIQSLKIWEFDDLTSITIGRSPNQQVVIDHPLVSRLHAEISIKGQQLEITNHGANGIYVNGSLVPKTILTDGSIVQLAPGGPQLKIKSPPLHQGNLSNCRHQGNPSGNLFCVHCGEPIVSEINFVRNYQILKTLGQGGMGTTYLAWDKPNLLVLKEMNADMATNQKARELFEREATILKQLNHRGIPKYYDFFVEQGKKYLAMELLHGQDLEARIYQKGPVPLSVAIDWMLQLCEILGYIHSQEPPLIHRDIKPANLLVQNVDNRLFLLDFGAVKQIGTHGSTRIGAPDYMAPEQNQGKPCIQSDLYAIGPTIIFLVTGRNPADFLELHGMGYRFNVRNIPAITPHIAQIIDRVTANKISDRYPNAQELANALNN